MSLNALPTELLEIIIQDTIPEGFEGVALTCKRLHSICLPFIPRHNELSVQFSKFVYRTSTLKSKHDIWTSLDLIARIAAEPIVARYIRHADFRKDSLSRYMPRRRRPFMGDDREDVDYHGAVAYLLANSAYLKQAGFEWD